MPFVDGVVSRLHRAFRPHPLGCCTNSEPAKDLVFYLVDRAELGLVHEVETDFTLPVRRIEGFWGFHVERSADLLQYKLLSDDGDFLMLAQVRPSEAAGTAACVEFYLYDPVQEPELFDPARPTWKMAASADRSEWRLYQERCERCQQTPRSAACACQGRQQIAVVRHSRHRIGGGVANCMEVAVADLCEDGSLLAWCPLLGRGDLAEAAARHESGTRRLRSMLPTWDASANTLALDFPNRRVVASVKNFQLTTSGYGVVCQFGKKDATSFALDIRHPLSVVQAFGIALTTLFWR
mmetsp:Transcript_23854/g.69045  ORF Transcript_23854/g.69045 Transcript_23854/m.69045 type:complete len:295 (-) Transcript_23854:78-962(-)